MKKRSACLDLIAAYTGQRVLDYGCGKGKMTRFLSTKISWSYIDAFDSMRVGRHFSLSTLEVAKEVNDAVETVIVLDDSPAYKAYDTVVLICVLHDNQDLIHQSRMHMRNGGNIIIFDHDKSHLTRLEFVKYLTDADIREIRARSFNTVFQEHSKMTIESCVKLGQKEGLVTVDGFDHSDPEFDGYPFYLWIGKKLNGDDEQKD